MDYHTIVLGAGAAGMMCAIEAGRGTLVLDHARAPGEKIRISGGGRCNFTNLNTDADNFLSANPHFCKSALSRYSQWDFLDLVAQHGIAWHEKTLGQLFCDNSAREIIAMLRAEMERAGADLRLRTEVKDVAHSDGRFDVEIETEGARSKLSCRNLVLATGGKSIPKMGATGLAYEIAAHFGLTVTETRPALVPLTFSDQRFKDLSGVSLPVRVANDRTAFDEALLFTHRGISGPAILQISSYWREGEAIRLDLTPGLDLLTELRARRAQAGRRSLSRILSDDLPARVVQHLSGEVDLSGRLADQSDSRLAELADRLQNWRIVPTGSEGYRTAEVTLGGIDTADLDSATMQARKVPGLFVIGEAVDVTGWLGGYNFQWAWSSGHAAGRAIAG